MTVTPGHAGLQPERTALAWQRTAITASIVMVPLVVVNARLGSWVMTMLGSVATTAAGVVVVRLQRRFGQLRDGDSAFSPIDPLASVAAVTGLTALVALGTALVVFLR